MKSDFEMITKVFNEDRTALNIFPLGDLHIGSPEFDFEMWEHWKDMVDEHDGYIVMVGDLVDNGLRNSKTSPFEATMRPSEQKAWLKRELYPYKTRIIGACRGNHEFRTVDIGDDCPLYDVMSKLDLEDYYRENMAFIKISLGKNEHGKRNSYNIVLAHGGSDRKVENFSYAIDGMDIFITGHTHKPTNSFPSKICIDSRNETVKIVDYTHIVVPSFSKIGGYTLRNMYMPQGSKIPFITLSGIKKGVKLTWID